MMIATSIHAGGAADFRRAVREREARWIMRRHVRFAALVKCLCKERGVLAFLRISAAWRRVRSRRPDKSRCLWLGA